MHSVLDQLDREDRLLNASTFGLQGYVDTLSPLIDMHLLDRSCVIVGKKLKYCVAQQFVYVSTHVFKFPINTILAQIINLYHE